MRSSPIPKQNNPQGAVAMEAKNKIEHNDQINQEIIPGQAVAFCYSGAPGIKLGTVVKLTQHRVRIAYNWQWYDNTTKETRITKCNYLSTPERILVLSESLNAELILLKLKGMLP